MLYAESQIQLIDRAMLALDLDSFNKLGKKLGVAYQVFSRAYKNDHFLSEYYIVLLCSVSGLDPFKTLACIREEEAKQKGNDEKAKFWHKQVNAA